LLVLEHPLLRLAVRVEVGARGGGGGALVVENAHLGSSLGDQLERTRKLFGSV